MTGHRFAVSLRWEVEEGVDVNIIVRGLLTPRVPATRYEPEEGGELEDLEIGNENGCPLPQAVVDALSSNQLFLSAVTEKIEHSYPDWDSINKAEKEG